MNIDHLSLAPRLLAPALLLFPLSLSAQTVDESSYRLADATSLWTETHNAAGLTLDSITDRGVALIEGTHQSLGYRRVQEGNL